MFSLTIARLAAALRPKWHVGQAASLRRSDTQPAPGISVVIPSRNGRALLETALPTIASQSFHLPVEVIVVNNGSDDATPAWLADRTGAVPLDRAAAQREAARLAEFRAHDGGWNFGFQSGEWLPYRNPVSTAFALQALALWDGAPGSVTDLI